MRVIVAKLARSEIGVCHSAINPRPRPAYRRRQRNPARENFGQEKRQNRACKREVNDPGDHRALRVRWLAHFRDSLGKQTRHLRDGGVEDVEDKLRRDADGEHEQRHRNDDELFASGPDRQIAPQLSASGPLKSDCIMRMKTMAVKRRPRTATAVKEAASANEPLKMRNSPMNPLRPGRPNEENMATLIQPQSNGVRCMRPPKSLMPRSTAAFFEQPDVIEERGRGDAVIEDLHEDTAERRLNSGSGPRRRAHGKETEHAVTEMVDRQIRDHAFQIGLRPGRERGKDDRANCEDKQPAGQQF